ncbi:MAG: hypothetical protein ABIB79_01030, partial [archaeon]
MKRLLLLILFILFMTRISALGVEYIEINRNIEVSSASLFSIGTVNIAGEEFSSGVAEFGEVLNAYLENQESLTVLVPISSVGKVTLSNLSIKQKIKDIILINETELIDLDVFFYDVEGDELIFNYSSIEGVNVSIENGIVRLKNIDFSGTRQLRFSAFDGYSTVYTQYFNIFSADSLVVTPELTAKDTFKSEEEIEIDFEYLTKEELVRNEMWKEEYGLYEEESDISKDERMKIIRNVSVVDKSLKKQKGKFVKENESITAFLYREEELEDVDIEIEEIREGKFKIRAEKKREFRAGKYAIKLELIKDGVSYFEELDFNWGVLVINPDKAVYLENEKTFIAIGVLDDEGRMVCDADVVLEVTNPLNQTTVLSTSNGKISVSPECEFYGITDLPDYYTYYTVGGEGNYTMNLTAVTSNGVKNIEDSFVVQKEIDFDVSRKGPTRIYPLVPYRMDINVLINKNYNGLISEYVPASFEVTHQEGLVVEEIEETKKLSWDMKLKEGDELNLSYEFDAPDISPYMFLLGKLGIGDFEEGRFWQIASDATTDYMSPNQTGNPLNQWAAGDRVVSSDNLYATEFTNNEKLDTGNYSFGVPAGATIDGIEVSVEAQCSGKGCGSVNVLVDLSWDGGSTYTSTKSNTWTTTESLQTYGGDSDKWGRTWSADEFSNSTFRARMTKTTDNAGNLNVDHIKIRVYYTAVIVNNAPNDPTPEINSTNGLNTTFEDLNCFDTISDPDGDKMNVTVRWYKDSVLNLTIEYNDSYANNSFFNAVLESGNTSAGESWNCSLRLHDGTENSSWVSSSDLDIKTTIPSLDLNAPSNDSNFGEGIFNITLNTTVYDNDGEAMTVFIYGVNSTETESFYDYLIYKEEGVANNSEIIYNWTALPMDKDSFELQLLWHFDNDSSVENDAKSYDWSGNNNNGTWGGSVVYNTTGGKFGYGVEFDGAGDFVTKETDLGISAYPFTFSAWA